MYNCNNSYNCNNRCEEPCPLPYGTAPCVTVPYCYNEPCDPCGQLCGPSSCGQQCGPYGQQCGPCGQQCGDCIAYLPPRCDTQELAIFPVMTFNIAAPTQPCCSALTLACPSPSATTVWESEVTTGICCATSIYSIVLMYQGAPATIANSMILADQVTVWLNPSALKNCPNTLVASLTIRGQSFVYNPSAPTVPIGMPSETNIRYIPTAPTYFQNPTMCQVNFSLKTPVDFGLGPVSATVAYNFYDLLSTTASPAIGTAVAFLKLRYI